MKTATVDAQVSREGDLTVLAISGRLDAARLAEVREKVVSLPEQGHRRVIIDLSGLDWIDSSGVGLLVTLFRGVQARGGQLCVACLQRQPKEIFRLLGLDAAFRIFSAIDDAKAEMVKG